MRALRIGLVSYSIAFFGTILGIVLVLGLSGCTETISSLAGQSAYVQEFDWEFEAQDVRKLDVKTVNGNIEVTGDPSADTIRVHARMEVRASSDAAAREFAKKVLVTAEKDGDIVRAFRKYPRSLRQGSVSVSFTATVPETIDVDLSTTNGKAAAQGLAGAARLHTTNGTIAFRGSTGPFDFSTTNGDVEAAFVRMVEDGEIGTTNGSIRCTVEERLAPLSLSTTNGSIDLVLPPDASGRLDARTTHGSTSSEIPVAVTEAKKSQLVGPFGKGGPVTIKARTTNGSIRITTLH